ATLRRRMPSSRCCATSTPAEAGTKPAMSAGYGAENKRPEKALVRMIRDSRKLPVGLFTWVF
ncbi:hypothetical protein, partial [Paenibacillus durus]|uniref:hypothetical protein n=1 Tax=Paenibacillus durus TaxID=44251 RepID=UPI001B80B2E9